jgi:regulator of protease activity HflC (stomatin/prohibitin superfamily)
VSSQETDLASAALEEAVAVGFRVLRAVMIVLSILFVGSGLFQVDSNETAFLRTFGVLSSAPREAGIHLSLPVVQKVERVDRRPRRLTIESLDLRRSKDEQLGTVPTLREGGLSPKRDGYVLTGDANLLHVSLAAQVSASDPAHRVLVTAAESLEVVRVLLERAAVQAAAHRSAGSLVGGKDDSQAGGKHDYLKEVRQRLQDALDGVELGLNVDTIEFAPLRDLQPSPQLTAAFAEVAQASQKVDTQRSRAEGEATRTSGDGTISAARLVSKAQAKADETVAAAIADAARFAALSNEWNTQRQTLKERLIAQTLVDSGTELGDVFLVPEGELRVKLERDVRALDKKFQEEARQEQSE